VQAKELLTQSYHFELPQELIATHPASPRESAKLLVYDRKTDTITHTLFSEFEKFIPKDVALIFNDTKVIKARIFGTKPSGGKIELLINRALDAHTVHVYIRGKVKMGTRIDFAQDVQAEVVALHEDGTRNVVFYQHAKPLRFEELLAILDTIGHIPLPPYIQREDNQEDAREYQSVFATNEGAVAAPTASLHFGEEQHKRICENFAHAYITLHVGSGTFKPVEADIITEHPMHSEYYAISAHAKEIIQSTRPLLCIGTTATRTVEYFVRHPHAAHGEANLFLHPQNRPLRTNHILTNFHLPKSTLLMLVASFVGLEKTLALYEEAIKNRYRFYSYGDAMLIL
jgi:S-adenosylmethionine:tRNA ribosyltransferase-isomerase